MENILLFAGSFALLCLGVFFLFAIKFLNTTSQVLTKIETSLDAVSKTTDRFEKSLQITLIEANHTLQRSRESLSKTDLALESFSQLAITSELRLQELEDVIANSNQIVSIVKNFEQKIVDKIEGPLMGTINVVSAFYKGVSTMVSVLRGNKPPQHTPYIPINEQEPENNASSTSNEKKYKPNGIPIDSIVDGVVAVTKLFQQFTKR